MKTGAHRPIPLPFANDRTGMATITVPMGESVTFKKLLKRKVGPGVVYKGFIIQYIT